MGEGTERGMVLQPRPYQVCPIKSWAPGGSTCPEFACFHMHVLRTGTSTATLTDIPTVTSRVIPTPIAKTAVTGEAPAHIAWGGGAEPDGGAPVVHSDPVDQHHPVDLSDSSQSDEWQTWAAVEAAESEKDQQVFLHDSRTGQRVRPPSPSLDTLPLVLCLFLSHFHSSWFITLSSVPLSLVAFSL